MFIDLVCKVLRVTAVCWCVVALHVVFFFCVALFSFVVLFAVVFRSVCFVDMFYLTFRCDLLRFVSSCFAVCCAVLYFMVRCMLLRGGHFVACVVFWLGWIDFGLF